MFPRITSNRWVLAGAVIAVAIVIYGAWRLTQGAESAPGAARVDAEHAAASAPDRNSIDLSDLQLASVKVEPIEEREFPVEKQAIGSIDFDEYMTVQVFTPYQGRIIALYAAVGDDVKKGRPYSRSTVPICCKRNPR